MLNLLFPKQCIHCHKVGDYMCQDCKKQLRSHEPLCPFCHKRSQDGATCFACANQEGNYLDGCVIGFAYDEVIKSLLLKLKYYHRKHLATFLVKQLYMAYAGAPSLQTIIANHHSDVYITGVPSHWRRRHMVKGYNQSYILAKQLAELAQLPFKKLFHKKKHTKSQVALSRKERKQNLTDVFRTNSLGLRGDEVVVIVDDLITTGATLNELAKEIKTLFPEMTVWGAVLARKA